RSELVAVLAEAGLSQRVILCGFRQDVPRLLAGSDIFVLPTTYEGGTSQAVLEAMQQGLPVLVCRTGGMAEVLNEGVDALFAPVADPEGLTAALRTLLGDATLRARLGATARRTAALYSRHRMFEETRKRLDRLTLPEEGGPLRRLAQWLADMPQR